MAYSLRFLIQYRRRFNGITTIEILKRDYVATPVITVYNDWFLPSSYEVRDMLNVLAANGVGDFDQGPYDTEYSRGYWSSTYATNADPDSAYVVFRQVPPNYTDISWDLRGASHHVRPVRAFTSAVSYDLQDVGPAGGYIFWKSGNSYLEAASADLADSVWSNISGTGASPSGTSNNIGSGLANSNVIIGQVGHTTSAAKACLDYRLTTEVLVKETTILKAAGDPLEISWEGNLASIYEPSLASGAIIRVLAPPLSLRELYTADPQLYMVKIWDGTSGEFLRWQGFVNTEIYSEGYSNPLFSEITIYCNDGWKVLSNIKYKTAADQYYTGAVKLQEIMVNIFSKIGLSFSTVYTSIDIVPSDFQYNLFLYLALSNENFIDENGSALSCRAVLEGIMRGLCLIMYWEGDAIFVIDPINLHDTLKGRSYNASDWISGEQEFGIGGYLDIASKQITWGETGAQLDMVACIPELTIKYDPYTYLGFLFDFTAKENIIVDGPWIDIDVFWYNNSTTFKDWILYGLTLPILGVRELVDSDPIFFIPLLNSGGVAIYHKPLSFINADPKIRIKISMEAYVQTGEDSFNIFNPPGPFYNIYKVVIPIRVKVGDHYLTCNNSWLIDVPSGGIYDPLVFIEKGVTYLEYHGNEANIDPPYISLINDTWTEGSAIYEVDATGDIVVEILDEIWTYFGDQVDPWQNNQPGQERALRILLRNLQVDIVDTNNNPITNEGLQERAVLSTNLSGKSDITIETICGTGPKGSSRGAFKHPIEVYPDALNIEGLYRMPKPMDSVGGLAGTIYSTSKLVLQTIMSQYKLPRVKLSATFLVNNLDAYYRTKLIQDTNHLGDLAFWMASGTYNDREEIIRVDMVEVAETREAIVTDGPSLDSSGAIPSSSTPPPDIPGTPIAIDATNVIGNDFRAQWLAAVGIVDHYYITVDDDPAFTAAMTGYDYKDCGTALFCDVVGMPSGATYYYKVWASNSTGTSAESNVIAVEII